MAFVRPVKGRSKHSSAVVPSSGAFSARSLPQDIVEEVIIDDVEVVFSEEEDAISSHPHRMVPLQFLSRFGKKRMLLCLISALFIILIGSILFALSALAPTATVTLVPIRKDLRGIQRIIAVTGTPKGTEIQAVSVSATERSNVLTVNATGNQSIPAVAAKGTVTLYNSAPYPQTIVPGPGTILTGTDGVQVQLDSVVTIPKGNPPNSNGIAQVSAHALVPGSRGNITSGDINAPCCVTSVGALNEGAFSGGKDAQPYHVVAQSDVDGAVSTLKASLSERVQASLAAKLRTGERLGLITSCSQQPQSVPEVGAKADTVSVSLTMNCNGIAYDQRVAGQQATSLALREATQQFPS